MDGVFVYSKRGKVEICLRGRGIDEMLVGSGMGWDGEIG